MKLVIALLGATILSATAHAEVVTPASPDGWHLGNQRGAGSAAITGTYVPPSGSPQTGSLQFASTGPADKADYVNVFSDFTGKTLGNLINGSVSYDFYVDPSSTTSNLAPALRVNFANSSNQYGALIWEPVYNNVTLTPGTWQQINATNGIFWMSAYGNGVIEDYSRTLSDWATMGTTTVNGKTSYALDANSIIYGVEVGVGSGWTGTFNGAVDNVVVNFGGTNGVSANFEPNAVAPVPEPATWAMMIGGFGLIGAAARRRTVRGTLRTA